MNQINLEELAAELQEIYGEEPWFGSVSIRPISDMTFLTLHIKQAHMHLGKQPPMYYKGADIDHILTS